MFHQQKRKGKTLQRFKHQSAPLLLLNMDKLSHVIKFQILIIRYISKKTKTKKTKTKQASFSLVIIFYTILNTKGTTTKHEKKKKKTKKQNKKIENKIKQKSKNSARILPKTENKIYS